MMEMEASYQLIKRGTDFPDRYQERISSTAWKNLRAELIELRGSRCERCKEETASLDLHHIHYRSLGDEQPEDVELLCRECHTKANNARRPKRNEPHAMPFCAITPDLGVCWRMMAHGMASRSFRRNG
jgi:hypothetical protein